jgi:hypothetical protein
MQHGRAKTSAARLSCPERANGNSARTAHYPDANEDTVDGHHLFRLLTDIRRDLKS